MIYCGCSDSQGGRSPSGAPWNVSMQVQLHIEIKISNIFLGQVETPNLDMLIVSLHWHILALNPTYN